MCHQALYKFSTNKRYTNLLALCASTHEVELPVVDRDKDIYQRPHKKNYDINIRPSEEWTASKAELEKNGPHLQRNE